MDQQDFAYTHKPSYEEIDSYSGDDLAFHVFTDYGYGTWQIRADDVVKGDMMLVTDDMQLDWQNEHYADKPGMEFNEYRKLCSRFMVASHYNASVHWGGQEGHIIIELTLGDRDLDYDGREVEVPYVRLSVPAHKQVTVEPSEPQTVDPVTLKPIRNWVNVYGVDQAYGGPEEGGWYYNTYEPLFSVPCGSYEQAEMVRETLEQSFPRTGKSSNVLGGADFSVVIESHKGKHEPTERPYYS